MSISTIGKSGVRIAVVVVLGVFWLVIAHVSSFETALLIALASITSILIEINAEIKHK